MPTSANDVILRRLRGVVCTIVALASTTFLAEGMTADSVTIMQIQGRGQFSEYVNTQVETHGIVTLYTKNGANFWLQDAKGDDSRETSDGIFVAAGAFPPSGIKPDTGDLIRIVAEVQEKKFGTALPLTRLRRVKQIDVLSKGNVFPAAVKLTLLPSESIEQGIAFWESLEGMLVTLSDARVVAPTTRFGEFALLSKPNRTHGSGYYADSGHLLLRSLGEQAVDYNPERILVDDGTLQRPIIVRPGDEVVSLLAVVDYTYSNYKLQPLQFTLDVHEIEKDPIRRPSSRDSDAQELTLATFNVENLFDLLNNPGKKDRRNTPSELELEIKLNKLALAIQHELALPDILVVQEIENIAILKTLAKRINSQAQSGYEAVSFESSDVRGIEVGFMWNKSRVELKSAQQMAGAKVTQAFGMESTSPGREPLIGLFEFNGVEITVIGNHFKSKGGDDSLFGMNQPPQRNSEVQRKLQAQVVRDYVDSILEANINASIVVTGDLNDFQFAEPGEGSDHPVAILEGKKQAFELSNLIEKVKPAQRFTYVFNGNAQVLDHILVSRALLDNIKKVEIPHFNSNAPATLVSDPNTPRRSSDHDPIRASFRIE
ncbi:MAG: hypothetical protein ACC707_08375 [Thiohalomonadales bacterium]